jgi:WD40 repeat protein/serine/threonine protein kinase
MVNDKVQPPSRSALSDAATLSGGRLISALVRDQQRHWQQGDPVPVEAYLRHHAILNGDPEAVLDLIYSEWALREALGEEIKLEEYLARFPRFADSLRMQWEVHAVCRAARREASPPTISALDPCVIQNADTAIRAAASLPGIPGYEVLSILGRGGMGIVYKARHLGLKRLVALKMPRTGLDADPEELLRFRREAEAAASLQHLNLVQIHDVGAWQPTTGGPAFPYLSMEYVDGVSLDRRLHDGPLAPRDAAALAETLARAMHYAHQRGIVHRDLKPANVLLQIADCESRIEGESAIRNPQSTIPKITDFGLAKRLDAEGDQTRTGAIMGTPSYMAPEQAAGRTKDIGPATDVYALGAVLYETLSGRPPFKGTTVLDTLEQVRCLDPVPVRRLQPKTPRDLETICLKCLAKEPRKRYASALALADDLRRFLDGKPIVARPTPAWEHVWKAAKRRPGVTALIGLVLLVTVGGFLGILGQWLRAERSADEQRKTGYALATTLIQQLLEHDNTPRAHQVLDSFIPRPGQSDLRGFEWYYLYGIAHGEMLTLPGRECVAFSPDGQVIASAGDKGEIVIWDASGQRITSLRGHTEDVTAVAFSPDGKLLASAAKDNVVRLWDWHAGRESAALPSEHKQPPLCLGFSPDGGSLASTGMDAAVIVWDIKTGQKRLGLRLPNASRSKVYGVAIAFHPHDDVLATAGTDQKLWLWDWKAGGPPRPLEHDHDGAVHGLAFSPDGRLLATAGEDRTIKLWEMAAERPTTKPFATLRGHNRRVGCVAFQPGGKRLASGSWDRTIRIWDVPSGPDSPIPAPLVLRGHTGFLTGIAFGRGGRVLASVGTDHSVRLWDTEAQRPEEAIRAGRQQVTCLTFSRDGSYFATGSESKMVNLWNAQTKEVLAELSGHAKAVRSIAFSKDGTLLASASDDKTVKLWDINSRQLLHTLEGHAAEVGCLAFHPNRQLLASGCSDGSVKLWDARSGQETATFHGHDGAVHAVAFNPDGKQMASAGADHVVRLWNLKAGPSAEPRVLRGHAHSVLSLAFSADGTRLVSGSEDRSLIVWDAASGQSQCTLSGHDGSVDAVAFHPTDNRRFASSGSDNLVKVWDLDTRQEVLTLAGCAFKTTCLAFSPDGEKLVAGGGDPRRGHIKVWSARPWRKALERVAHFQLP